MHRLPRSVRKYIAHQKSIIRRDFSDTREVEDKIRNLYNKFGLEFLNIFP
jgi:hypothetical protein